MMVREIKVVYFDGSPVVYSSGKRLNEKEIVDLMVEYMEENHELENRGAFLEEFLKMGVQYEYYQQLYDKNKQIINILSDLEDFEVWKWEDLLRALDGIARVVGYETELLGKEYDGSYEEDIEQLQKEYKELLDENEQLKKGMIGVVDRYIKNVECNPPSSVRTYGKIKGALINIREDLRNLIGDLE